MTTAAPLTVVYRPVTALAPYVRNARTHSDEQVAQLAASIQAFGWTNPILVDESGGIVAGHGRLRAAQSLGMVDVPTICLPGLTEAQRRALVLADNKLALNAGWDFGLLRDELAELDTGEFDLSVVGFSDVELEQIATWTPDGLRPGRTAPDAAPEVPVVPVSRAGDLWLLGEHRLLCGDSAQAADVERVVGENRPKLVNTDPPYGIAYTDDARVAAERASGRSDRKTKWGGGIVNDGARDDAKLQAFLESVIRAAVPSVADNAAFYLWHPMLTQGTFFAAAAAAADILIHRQIIWVKPSLLFGFGDYHWRHELCFYGWRRGNRPEFYGERNQTTVWEITHEASNGARVHPTQKPVALFMPPITNHTLPGEAIYEPFAGSGSQIIAAEQTGRRCLAVEIAPEYVDVCIKRWQDFTGKEAEHNDGRTFAAIAAERLAMREAA